MDSGIEDSSSGRDGVAGPERMGRDPASQPRAQRFLRFWRFDAIAATAMVLLVGDLWSTTPVSPLGLIIILAGTTLAHLLSIPYVIGGSEGNLDLREVALAVVLLALSSVVAFATTVAAAGLAELARRSPPDRLAFNTASSAIATAIALAVLAGVRGGADPASVRGLTALGLALSVHAIGTWVALGELVSRIDRTTLAETLRGSWPVLVISSANVGLGVVAGVLWLQRPVLLLGLVVPVAVMVAVSRRVLTGSGRLTAALGG